MSSIPANIMAVAAILALDRRNHDCSTKILPPCSISLCATHLLLSGGCNYSIGMHPHNPRIAGSMDLLVQKLEQRLNHHEIEVAE